MTVPRRASRILWRWRAVALGVAALLLASVSGAHAEPPSGGLSVSVTVQTPAALEVEIQVQPARPGGELEEGAPFRVVARVTNSGAVPVSDGEASLFVDVSGLQLAPPGGRSLRMLAPGEAREVRWNVIAREPGLYVLTVEASGIDPFGEPVAGDASAALEVQERTRPGGRPS